LTLRGWVNLKNNLRKVSLLLVVGIRRRSRYTEVNSFAYK
jgi:hypothetical protein